MADSQIKISALPAASTAANDDVIAGVQSGTTKKFPLSVLLAYIKGLITPADIGAVPDTRTVNGQALSVDVALDAGDIDYDNTNSGLSATDVQAAIDEVEGNIPAASSADPQMDGTAAAGSSTDYSRADHVHPTDTSRASAADAEILAQIADRIYPGVDLTTKYAGEIAAPPYNGDAWAWIKARITAGDYAGIHVGDYIPFATTEATPVTYHAQIAGINTYTGYGDTPVGNHIDFVSIELWSTRKKLNLANYNNGVPAFTPDGGTEIAAIEYPWLASDLYLFLNSLSGYVPNSVTLNPTMTAEDYTSGGVFYYLPSALQSVIVEKRAYIPKRFSTNGLLTDDNGGGWADIGKLWIPSELEVYGVPVWGDTSGNTTMGSIHYPLFDCNMLRAKKRSGSVDNWWLLNATAAATTTWCRVGSDGLANFRNASLNTVGTPVCFRVA